jgi:hypothetical protein
MNTFADGVLTDVRGLRLDNMGSAATDNALDWILASNSGCNFNSFNSSI